MTKNSIPENTYLTASERITLYDIWFQQEQAFSFSKECQLEQLIRTIFNPLKTRSSLLSLLEKMPFSSHFQEQDIKKLERNRLIVILPDGPYKRATLTPDGLILLASTKDFDAGKNLKTLKNEIYEEFCFHQINRLKKKETLKPKHVAVLLFLLLNGSTDPQKAYVVKSYEDELCIERVVLSYINGPTSSVGKPYSLPYFLVEAKRILGNVIYNKAPKYYIEPEKADYVIDSVADAIEKDPHFLQRWQWLKDSYHDNITYINISANSYYSSRNELELTHRFLKKWKGNETL